MRKTKYPKRNRLLEDDWYCGTEKEAIETGLAIMAGEYHGDSDFALGMRTLQAIIKGKKVGK